MCRFVDEALGFAAGWNFFIFEAVLVPFEVTACNLAIHYWSDIIPTAVVIAIVLVLYALINVLTIKWYGETEFWAALGKVLLAIGLIIFTFIVMVGGNPQHDRFGFRYWHTPGAFAELYSEGSLGRWLGFLSCLIQAAFLIAGPDYVSMTAGEAESPRKTMPRAFNAVFYRLTAFFVLGALCVGILVPYDDPEMAAAFKTGEPGAAASPYVVAMNRLGIKILPHIVNAMLMPFGAWYGLSGAFVMMFVQGYTVFLSGFWDVPNFLFSYTMISVFPALYIGWKLFQKTTIHKPHNVNLREDLDVIDEYERNVVSQTPE
ncbi:unnamed protein product [Clonostachys rhizophaga]|uniref:Amino acid permease/ SLC12A domain-containing protein n=1 Tax=Clonostachys rhizophaga TaxID=160324 RepID=A0A9N9V109_9HYPO|nr:unnamed protein product [Clonostachys rhizophaga]